MKFLTSLSPFIALLVTVLAIVGIGVLKTTGLLDQDMASMAISFLLGGGSGAALVGGFSKPVESE